MTAVHYVADGPPDGPVAVLSGSLGSDVRMWEPQVAPLAAQGFRVIRYDHRGHRGSPVPPGPYSLDDLGADALALLDELGVERVHWVGLSLGGMVGMWLGGHAPHRIAGLTLLCTAAALDGAVYRERAAVVRADGTASIAADVVRRWVTPGFRAAHPDRVAELESMVAATPAQGYAGCCAAIAGMDLTGDLPAIAAPTLAIAGAQDPATPPERLREIAAAIPHARVAVVDPGAHLVNVERPDQVTDLILDHLRESR